MADAKDIGQKAVDAYNRSIKQPSQADPVDQGSGPSVPNRGPGQPQTTTSKVGNLVVQKTTTYKSRQQELNAQQAAQQKTSQQQQQAKKSNDAYSQIGTNVSYSRAKNAIGVPQPKPKKKGK